jgi:dTDP-4-amino-4,6-dideoxygalactose transaminase
MIPVTKPFLPPFEDYRAYIEGIWQRNWLTNNGPLVNELELKLKEYLQVPHLLYVTNGTIALQLAIKALELRGEIITTPFSYVATTSSIVWESCTPVFVDIDPSSLNIDAAKIEASVTPKTSAILATHVYGNPCDVEAIATIAEKYNLKVIYDAAHCFGSKFQGKTVFAYGDISTTSFHSTKIFHTVEGGAVFTKDPELLKRMAYMRNFGHDGYDKFNGVGINGKNSEFHAAMGLTNLKYFDQILLRRKELSLHYDRVLVNLNAERVKMNSSGQFNYAYYPIVMQSEEVLEKTLEELNKHWIYPRRYFYPSLSTLGYVEKTHTPHSDSISARVLCLPLFHELSFEEIDLIARIILRVQNN